MSETQVTYAAAAGSGDLVAWVTVPRAQWDVQMEVTQALQERADKAEAECEQWQRLVAFLRERLAKSQKHNREAATYCRASLSGVWKLGQQTAAAELAEVRADRDRNSQCYRELADAFDALRARRVQTEIERDAAQAALGRASLLLNDAATGLELTRHVSSETSGYIERALRTADAIRAFLADPTGQAAAERWRKLETVAATALVYLFPAGEDEEQARLALKTALAALAKGKEQE